MMNDLRYALRTLAHRPSFTAVAIITLAIGIGANVAIFSLVSGVLLKPLPLRDPDRLVVIWDTHPSLPVPFMVASPPRVIAWRHATQVFDEVGAFASSEATLSESGLAERIPGAGVYEGLLPALGVSPAIGRIFTDDEYRPGAPRVVILGDSLWRRRFSADRGIVGRAVKLSGFDYTVVGIMPPGFNFLPSITIEGKPPLERAQFLTPIRIADPGTQRGSHSLTAIGRLRRGVTLDSANRQMKEVAAREAAANPQDVNWSVQLVPLLTQATGALRPTLLTLVGAVAFVLLLACTNVANLLIARGIGRRRELAVRAALGASRWRLARQLFTESMVLGVTGGAAGLLFASWCVRFARVYGLATVTRLDEVQVDGRVILFALGVSLVAALLFGLAPLAQMLRPSSQADSLKDRSGDAGAGGTRLRSALVVVEVSFAIVLLVGGVLLMQSFLHLRGIDPGFRPAQAMTFRVALPPEQYPGRAERLRFTEEAVRRLTSATGVQAAGAIDSVPIAENRQGTDVTIDGLPQPPPGQEVNSGFSFPTAGYFEAVGLAVLRGRGITDRDRADSPPIVVINQALARRLFGDADPIGRRIHAGFNHQTAREIVGIVADEHHTGLGRPPQANLYTPFAQTNWNGGVSFVVRSTADVTTTATAAREVLRSIDQGAALYGVRTLNEVVSQSIATERFAAGLFAAFALAALTLAFIGVYGVTDQAVSQRTREFGVRIALGADGRRIRSLVIGGSLRLSAIGIVIGVAIAAALSRVIAGQLVGVSPFEPGAYAAVVAVLAVSGVAAAYLPARKATNADPMVALRAE